MATESIREFGLSQACRDNNLTARAYQIIEYGHDSARSLIEAFCTVKGGRPGAATDEQQDILRAAIVMAGACIDSSLKQLFRDCLPDLILTDNGVKREFETFVERALRRTDSEAGIDCKLLACALTSTHPLNFLSEAYVYSLTGASLQSTDQLFAACRALGLNTKNDVPLDKAQLDKVFSARNDIVHEMDIDFDAPRRNRFQRRLEDTIRMANGLLVVSERICKVVHAKLPQQME